MPTPPASVELAFTDPVPKAAQQALREALELFFPVSQTLSTLKDRSTENIQHLREHCFWLRDYGDQLKLEPTHTLMLDKYLHNIERALSLPNLAAQTAELLLALMHVPELHEYFLKPIQAFVDSRIRGASQKHIAELIAILSRSEAFAAHFASNVYILDLLHASVDTHISREMDPEVLENLSTLMIRFSHLVPAKAVAEWAKALLREDADKPLEHNHFIFLLQHADVMQEFVHNGGLDELEERMANQPTLEYYRFLEFLCPVDSEAHQHTMHQLLYKLTANHTEQQKEICTVLVVSQPVMAMLSKTLRSAADNPAIMRLPEWNQSEIFTAVQILSYINAEPVCNKILREDMPLLGNMINCLARTTHPNLQRTLGQLLNQIAGVVIIPMPPLGAETVAALGYGGLSKAVENAKTTCFTAAKQRFIDQLLTIPSLAAARENKPAENSTPILQVSLSASATAATTEPLPQHPDL